VICILFKIVLIVVISVYKNVIIMIDKIQHIIIVNKEFVHLIVKMLSMPHLNYMHTKKIHKDNSNV